MTNYSQAKGKQLRVATCGLLFEMLFLILLTIRYLRVGLEAVGVYTGIALGILAGIFYITIWFHSMKKGIFVVQCQAAWKFWMKFFVTVLILGLLISVMLSLTAGQFQQIDISGLLGTILLVGICVYLAIATAGAYWLEGRYRKKLYLAKRNK